MSSNAWATDPGRMPWLSDSSALSTPAPSTDRGPAPGVEEGAGRDALRPPVVSVPALLAATGTDSAPPAAPLVVERPPPAASGFYFPAPAPPAASAAAPTPVPAAPSPAGAVGTDLHDLVRHRGDRPVGGWRGAVFAVTGGWCNPGLSPQEAARRRLLEMVRTHLPGWAGVVVASVKGGVGKTTVAAGLGLTLAEHRGDRIVALDGNPDLGTLADRLTGHCGVTVRDLVENLDTIRSWTDIAHYTSLAGRLQVLASDQDAAMSEAFSREEYAAVMRVLSRYYNVIIADSGTGMVHSVMGGALDDARTLVLVAAPTVDAATRASKTLDWLVAHGYEHLARRAVVALSCDRSSPRVDRDRVVRHFQDRCEAVVPIPPDPHLQVGGRINLADLRPRTADAFLELAAHVAKQFDVNRFGGPQ